MSATRLNMWVPMYAYTTSRPKCLSVTKPLPSQDKYPNTLNLLRCGTHFASFLIDWWKEENRETHVSDWSAIWGRKKKAVNQAPTCGVVAEPYTNVQCAATSLR